MKRKRVLSVIGAILVLVAAVVILNLTLRGSKYDTAIPVRGFVVAQGQAGGPGERQRHLHAPQHGDGGRASVGRGEDHPRGRRATASRRGRCSSPSATTTTRWPRRR